VADNLTEIADQLEELSADAYNILNQMRDLLRGVPADIRRRAKAYWLAHIDCALENRDGCLGKSMTTLADTVAELRELLKERVNDHRTRG